MTFGTKPKVSPLGVSSYEMMKWVLCDRQSIGSFREGVATLIQRLRQWYIQDPLNKKAGITSLPAFWVVYLLIEAKCALTPYQPFGGT